MSMILLPGTEVAARGLRWELVFTQNLGAQNLHRLRGIEGVLAGQEIDLLEPFEPIVPIARNLRPEQPAPIHNWLAYHRAFLLEQAFGSSALNAVQPGRLRIEPYQIVPVLRAIRMTRVRLLLADAVGLGKTVQTGLLLTELIARRMAHRILVIAPSGLLVELWQSEMARRFGLRFQVIDRQLLESVRRSTELGSIPFDHIPLGVASMAFLRQEKVLQDLERSSYDVVVIDEAHHCMETGNGDPESTLQRKLAEVVARRSDTLILATATPHDGNDRSFASLCELLDPSLVDGAGRLRGHLYRQHVVRRLKRHVRDAKGQPLFKDREVHPCPVDSSPERHGSFIDLHKELTAILAPELRKALRARRYSDVLSFISLLKRSVSTVAAAMATLAAVRERYRTIHLQAAESQEGRRQRLRTLRDLHRKLERLGAASADEENEQQSLVIEDLAQQLAGLEREASSEARQIRRHARMADAIDALIAIAAQAAPNDPKLHAILAQVHAIRSEEPRANILIYTEYIDSQLALVAALNDASVGEVLSMNGDDPDEARSRVTARFTDHDNIVLVSTDAAAEGLNLHHRCHHLLHLDLPFNPNRLEQRNGRIDRFGQLQTPIVHYFYLRGTFEERILLRLVSKYENQRRTLTFVPNTLGVTASCDAAAGRLLAGLVEEEASLFNRPEPVFNLADGSENHGADEATRELLEEIDRSIDGYQRAAASHPWLGPDGLHAEAHLLVEADQARLQGTHLNHVNLLAFVQDAALMEGGSARNPSPGIVEVTLPPSWLHGLHGMPGFDADSRTLRLTEDLALTHDPLQREVGFLGRAHPVVRRALDRVRHLALGGRENTVDQRVSAVAATLPQPALLFTFIGRVQSRAGREIERVLAVLIRPDSSPEILQDPRGWLDFARPENAINTRDAWKNHFASWASASQTVALDTALGAFAPIASDFIEHRQSDLAQERRQLHEWLASRTREITGAPATTHQQPDLFLANAPNPSPAVPDWLSLSDPLPRLTAFASDQRQPVPRRHEAQTLLALFSKRRQLLDERLAFLPNHVSPLGMLMLVPRSK